jgi:hypothetical protein
MWNTYLTRQQDVLTSLRHRTISSRTNQDRAVCAAPVIMFFSQRDLGNQRARSDELLSCTQRARC